ncbi:hypothetical protein D3C74_303310 [compost metagenome]
MQASKVSRRATSTPTTALRLPIATTRTTSVKPTNVMSQSPPSAGSWRGVMIVSIPTSSARTPGKTQGRQPPRTVPAPAGPAAPAPRKRPGVPSGPEDGGGAVDPGARAAMTMRTILAGPHGGAAPARDGPRLPPAGEERASPLRRPDPGVGHRSDGRMDRWPPTTRIPPRPARGPLDRPMPRPRWPHAPRLLRRADENRPRPPVGTRPSPPNRRSRTRSPARCSAPPSWGSGSVPRSRSASRRQSSGDSTGSSPDSSPRCS